jgi:hypothetical protein
LFAGNDKDTSQLLAAGTDRVYWLKTLKDSIGDGFDELFTRIPENTVIVCESNSLRKIVKPGVFVMIKNVENPQIKKSAIDVINFADILFENDFKADLEILATAIENIMISTSKMPNESNSLSDETRC